MFNRKKLDRERLEIYLVYLLLAARPFILICGLFLLVFSILILNKSLYSGIVLLIGAAYLLSLGSSFRIALLTAKWGAWLATLGQEE